MSINKWMGNAGFQLNIIYTNRQETGLGPQGTVTNHGLELEARLDVIKDGVTMKSSGRKCQAHMPF